MSTLMRNSIARQSYTGELPDEFRDDCRGHSVQRISRLEKDEGMNEEKVNILLVDDHIENLVALESSAVTFLSDDQSGMHGGTGRWYIRSPINAITW